MKLSVIIPCFNSASTLGAQLEALSRQEYAEPWEVIVSDNGSTDESLNIAESFRGQIPGLRTVDSSERRGAAYARNVGASAARGEALAFCDADDVVGNGWVQAIGKSLSRYNFVASRIDVEKLNPSWVSLTRGNKQCSSLLEYNNPPYLRHAGGSGLGVVRTLHEAIGGFDESMGVLEDTDYCWRLQLSGAKLHFVPEALVYVRRPRTLWKTYHQAFRWAAGNVAIYKRYRTLGMGKYNWKPGLLAWKKILLRASGLRSKADFAKWAWSFGWAMGRIWGSYRYRVFAP